MDKKRKIILASGSPRRKELLEGAGIAFEIMITDADESINEELQPPEFAGAVSRRKAEAAVRIYAENTKQESVIIAADTIVYVDGKILGKPKDRADAFVMLKELEGKWHSVYTGLTVAFIHGGVTKYIQESAVTRVKFKHLTEDQIEGYIDTGEPFDKAGAYAVQGVGAQLIEEIDGDYNNVVGLPVDILLEILEKKGGEE